MFYIAIVLTIHVLLGLYSVITTSIMQTRYYKQILAEVEERNKFFGELAKELKEGER